MKFIVIVALAVHAATAIRASLYGKLEVASTSKASLREQVHELLTGAEEFQLSKMVGEPSEHISYKQAQQSLIQLHSVPDDVQVVFAQTSSNSSLALDEDSLTKARQFLNIMVEKAQSELDDKVIEAKEFHARNRGAHAQVVADVATLAGYISNLMGQTSEAETCIEKASDDITAAKKHRQDEMAAYDREYEVNLADMTVKQNDLDVFDFLIKATKQICDSQAFVQLAQEPELQLCSTSDGQSLRFSDEALQAKFSAVLAKGSHDIVGQALGHAPVSSTAFVQTASEQPSRPKTPVQSGQADDVGAVKCGPIPDCGLLYDTLSVQWGTYKDRVDELKNDMDDNHAAWVTLKSEIDAQIAGLSSKLDDCTRQLAESTGAKNMEQQELEQKQAERRALDDEHSKTMKEYRDRIEHIVQQDICGPTVVRNEIMKHSTLCPPSSIDDCDVGAWTAMTCSVECDDGCPDRSGCGGTQTLTRAVVTAANDCGIKCPQLSRTRMCNQVKCPVDCVMSKWSGWSKCSKECEGGIQQMSRAVMTRHRNGGQACSAVSEARPCNTQSCDRNCRLSRWAPWSPCSQACGGGSQKRVRDVMIPIRGDGKCPKTTSRWRLQVRQCNVQECVGDEICIAEQDLVIAVDGSGSITADGFKLVRNFTGELLKRYKVQYYGAQTMQIGLIQFGNGAIEEDGTISKALLLHELSTNLAETRIAASQMTQQKGFTNMAQAFSLAEKLILQRGRKPAQAAVMMISDGKPSFVFETTQQAKNLEQKGISRFMIGITEFPGSDEWGLVQSLASQPADTNTLRVPGISALEDGGGPFVEQAIAKFCPASESPSSLAKVWKQKGWMLVRKKGSCGRVGRVLRPRSNGRWWWRTVRSRDECFQLAQKAGATSFTYGRRWRWHWCNVGLGEFDCPTYNSWLADPSAADCPASSPFRPNAGLHWYAIQPSGCN